MERTPRRLRRRREFLHVARTGRKWAAPGLVLQAIDRRGGAGTDSNGAGPDDIRVGFTVTRKVGGAVVRNRARRRLRAAAEAVMPTHAADGHDFVVIGRAGTLRRPFPALIGDLETALRRVGAWRDTADRAGGAERDEE